MTPAARIIRQLLLDLGHASASGDWQAFVADMPDQPFNCIGAFDTAGMQDGRLMAGTQIIHDGVQVQVRGISYPIAWEKARDIALAMDTQSGTEVVVGTSETFIVTNISRKGAVNFMGMEDQGDRNTYLFSINACLTCCEA